MLYETERWRVMRPNRKSYERKHSSHEITLRNLNVRRWRTWSKLCLNVHTLMITMVKSYLYVRPRVTTYLWLCQHLKWVYFYNRLKVIGATSKRLERDKCWKVGSDYVYLIMLYILFIIVFRQTSFLHDRPMPQTLSIDNAVKLLPSIFIVYKICTEFLNSQQM